MTEPGHLKPRTVAIIFGIVGLAYVVVCLSVGAWPLALGAVIAVLLIPLLFLLLNLIGSVSFSLLFTAVSHILPKRFRGYASGGDLPTAGVVLIFAIFVGILLLIYRSVMGVLVTFSIAGVLFGLPWLAERSRQQKLKRTANNTSELTSGGRADASPEGSST